MIAPFPDDDENLNQILIGKMTPENSRHTSSLGRAYTAHPPTPSDTARDMLSTARRQTDKLNAARAKRRAEDHMTLAIALTLTHTAIAFFAFVLGSELALSKGEKDSAYRGTGRIALARPQS